MGTPVGVAALAVVRVSGPLAQSLAANLLGTLPEPRVATRGDYRDIAGRLVDDVLFTFFRRPRSYTGEDGLEISAHGNPLIAQKIVEDLVARGCRLAEPGEFTKRAFLNGQMELGQAEAVMDLIHARSERALDLANRQLRGALGRHMEKLVAAATTLLAVVEAYIDFPEEDLPPEDQTAICRGIEDLLRDTRRLRSTQHYGEVVRDGIRTVIVGAPNAGKSSLLNRLLGRERALVSPEPGTTRDYLEEPLRVAGHLLRLIDTAGLNPSPTEIERRGIEKSLEQIRQADLLLWVVDASQEPGRLTSEIEGLMASKEVILILNKCDLPQLAFPNLGKIEVEAVRFSAKSGWGQEELERAVARCAERFRVEVGDEELAINARHALALEAALSYLEKALSGIKTQLSPEFVSSDLRATLAAFGEISGRIDNEAILDVLFGKFCIGK